LTLDFLVEWVDEEGRAKSLNRVLRLATTLVGERQVSEDPELLAAESVPPGDRPVRVGIVGQEIALVEGPCTLQGGDAAVRSADGLLERVHVHPRIVVGWPAEVDDAVPDRQRRARPGERRAGGVDRLVEVVRSGGRIL